VRVNAVAPGVIDTDMVAALPKIAKDTISNTIPLTRFGQPEDIANGMLFLASEAASYITGVTLQIDGGYVPSNHLA
jgi:3-oxoacyl-[acyl-carrier protein] reductase/7-alpha-hydroxysteroid dehydrogenase